MNSNTPLPINRVPFDAACFRRRTGRHGFTFMEMAVSLSILAILLAIGVPMFLHDEAMRNLEQAQREVVATFVYARQMAIAQGGTTITIGPGTVTVTSASGTVLRNYVDPDPDITMTTPDGVTTITFAQNGSASCSGTFSLTVDSTTRSFNLIGTTGGVTQQ